MWLEILISIKPKEKFSVELQYFFVTIVSSLLLVLQISTYATNGHTPHWFRVLDCYLRAELLLRFKDYNIYVKTLFVTNPDALTLYKEMHIEF